MTPTRDSKFEWVFANAFSLLISENEVMVKCGLSEDPAKVGEELFERVGLVLTPKGAKLLGYILTNTMAQWEKANGLEIPLDTAKIAEKTQMVKGGG